MSFKRESRDVVHLPETNWGGALDVYEFSAKLTESLAWPLVAIIAIFVFRRDARAGLARLRKVDAFGVTAEFDELKRLETAVDKANAEEDSRAIGSQDTPALDVHPSPEEPPAGATADDAIRYSVAPEPSELNEPPLTPEATILTEWNKFDMWLRQLHASSGLARLTTSPPSLAAMLHDLIVVGGGPSNVMEAVMYARDVRNKVAHGEHRPSEAEAQRYKMALRNLRFNLGP